MRYTSKTTKIITHSSIYLIGTIIAGTISIITFPILARLIPIEEFGKYDFFIFLLLISSPLCTCGLSTGLGTIAHNSPKTITSIANQFLKIQFIPITIITLFLLLANTLHIFQSFSINTIFLFSLALLGLSSTTIISAVFIWTESPIKATLLSQSGWKIGGILGIFAIILSQHYTSFTYLFALSITFLITASIGYLLWILPFHPQPPPKGEIKSLIKLSWPYGLATCLFFLSTGIEKMMILKLLGPKFLGLYSMIDKTASIPRMLAESTLLAIIPALTKSKHTEEKIPTALSLSVSYLILIFVTSILLAKHIISIFGGNKYLSVYHILPIATINQNLILLPTIINTFFLKKKQTYAILIYAMISITVTLLLGNFLIHYFNIAGCISAGIIGKLIGISLLLKYQSRIKCKANKG